jgi:hypothetical protein
MRLPVSFYLYKINPDVLIVKEIIMAIGKQQWPDIGLCLSFGIWPDIPINQSIH